MSTVPFKSIKKKNVFRNKFKNKVQDLYIEN